MQRPSWASPPTIRYSVVEFEQTGRNSCLKLTKTAINHNGIQNKNKKEFKL